MSDAKKRIEELDQQIAMVTRLREQLTNAINTIVDMQREIDRLSEELEQSCGPKPCDG